MIDLVIYCIASLLNIPYFGTTILFLVGLSSALIIFKLLKYMFAE